MIVRTMLVIALAALAACGGSRPTRYVAPPRPVQPPQAPTTGPLVSAGELEGVVKRIHIGGTDDGLRLRITAEVQSLMGAALEPDKLRAALVRVMKVRGVADVVARGEQLADGVGLILEVVQEPVLRNITAVEKGGKRISLGKVGVGLGIGSLLDPLRVQQAAEALRERYVERGHLEATASWRRVPAHEGVDVIIEIEPGVPSTIDRLVFVGNASFPSHVLAAEVPSLFAGAAVLEDDIARAVLVLNAFYWDRGHANVRIVTPRLGAGRIPIEFAIDEGPVFRIGAISLTGDVVPADHAMLLSTFAVNTGDLFSRTAIVDGRAAVEKALSARGSTFEIVPLTKVDLANRTIDLTLEITRK